MDWSLKYIVKPAFKKCILWIKFTFLLSGETVVLQQVIVNQLAEMACDIKPTYSL